MSRRAPHPIRCRCGKLQGRLTPSAGATRALCYCKDCQAYARFLGTPGITDADGGTEVVASLPAQLELTEGLESLACMSLSPRGLLRWYASCCGTPIGNTPRDPKLPYVGVVHNCLETASQDLASSFGSLDMAVNTGSARNKVRSRPAANVAGLIKLVPALIAARLTGRYRRNPFFLTGTRTPIRPVRVLTDAERAQAYGA
jgi:hypothetical protein